MSIQPFIPKQCSVRTVLNQCWKQGCRYSLENACCWPWFTPTRNMETVLAYMGNMSIHRWYKHTVLVEGLIRLWKRLNRREGWLNLTFRLCDTFKKINKVSNSFLKQKKSQLESRGINPSVALCSPKWKIQHCFRGYSWACTHFFQSISKGKQHTLIITLIPAEKVAALLSSSVGTAPLEPTGIQFPFWGHLHSRSLQAQRPFSWRTV